MTAFGSCPTSWFGIFDNNDNNVFCAEAAEASACYGMLFSMSALFRIYLLPSPFTLTLKSLKLMVVDQPLPEVQILPPKLDSSPS
jgi:hypothetical protein